MPKMSHSRVMYGDSFRVPNLRLAVGRPTYRHYADQRRLRFARHVHGGQKCMMYTRRRCDAAAADAHEYT